MIHFYQTSSSGLSSSVLTCHLLPLLFVFISTGLHFSWWWRFHGANDATTFLSWATTDFGLGLFSWTSTSHVLPWSFYPQEGENMNRLGYQQGLSPCNAKFPQLCTKMHVIVTVNINVPFLLDLVSSNSTSTHLVWLQISVVQKQYWIAKHSVTSRTITVSLTLNTNIQSFRVSYDDVPSNWFWLQIVLKT